MVSCQGFLGIGGKNTNNSSAPLRDEKQGKTVLLKHSALALHARAGPAHYKLIPKLSHAKAQRRGVFVR